MSHTYWLGLIVLTRDLPFLHSKDVLYSYVAIQTTLWDQCIFPSDISPSLINTVFSSCTVTMLFYDLNVTLTSEVIPSFLNKTVINGGRKINYYISDLSFFFFFFRDILSQRFLLLFKNMVFFLLVLFQSFLMTQLSTLPSLIFSFFKKLAVLSSLTVIVFIGGQTNNSIISDFAFFQK